MDRMSTDARRASRRKIRDMAEAEMRKRVAALLRSAMSGECAGRTHDGCRESFCLCECHDNEEETATGHRCSVCGGGVELVGGLSAISTWAHVTVSDHPAKPVRKRDSI